MSLINVVNRLTEEVRQTELDELQSEPNASLTAPEVLNAVCDDTAEKSDTRYATYFGKLFQLLTDVTVTGSNQQLMTADAGASEAMEIILAAASSGKKVMCIGNGGSAAIASHQALDLWKSAGVQATCFNDAAQLTCLGNDFGYEYVFSKAVEMFSQPGDVLVAISSSGSSPNILNAVKVAKDKGCVAITYSGFAPDCPLRSLGNLNFHIACSEYGLVEVAHMALVHHLTDKLTEKRHEEKAAQ